MTRRWLCWLGFHDSEREDFEPKTVCGPFGGVMRWDPFKFRCKRCRSITLDGTLPPWLSSWPKPTLIDRLRRRFSND